MKYAVSTRMIPMEGGVFLSNNAADMDAVPADDCIARVRDDHIFLGLVDAASIEDAISQMRERRSYFPSQPVS